jgi:hypothetical protein
MTGNPSFTIDKLGRHTNTHGNPESVARIHARFKVIIFFLQDNRLTVRTILAVNNRRTVGLRLASQWYTPRKIEISELNAVRFTLYE